MLGSSLRSVWRVQVVCWRPVAEACGSTCRWSRPFCWCALSGLSSSAEGPGKWSANKSRRNRSRWSHYLQRWRKNCGRKRTKQSFRDSICSSAAWDGPHLKLTSRSKKSEPCKAFKQASSMAYLLQDFKDLAQRRSKEVDPTFLHLKDVFWGCEDKIGQDVLCPRDGQLGCALVDWLPRHHRRQQTHFLSWSWRYSLGQLWLDPIEIWRREVGLT